MYSGKSALWCLDDRLREGGGQWRIRNWAKDCGKYENGPKADFGDVWRLKRRENCEFCEFREWGVCPEGPKGLFACICVHLRSIFGLKTAIWTANGRKWTQMGAGNSLRRGFLAGKQEWGRKTGGEGGGNCEIREKWVGKCFETAQNGRKTTNFANGG